MSQPVSESYPFHKCRDTRNSNHCKGLGHICDSTSGANLMGTDTYQFRFKELSLGREEVVRMRRTRVVVTAILP